MENHIVYVISHKSICIEQIVDIITFKVNPDEFKYLYVGITGDFENRMRQHKNNIFDIKNKKSLKLYNRLRAHGWDAYNKTIIYTGLSEQEAKNMEIETISKYNSYEQGLNSTPGGEGGVPTKVKIYDNKTREIILFDSIRSAASYIGTTDKSITAVLTRENSQTFSPIFNKWFQIRHANDDSNFLENMPTKTEKISEQKCVQIAVINIYTKEELEFDSIKQAAHYFDIKAGNITAVLTGNCRQFYADKDRYDVQYIPKNREWNLEIPEKPETRQIVVVNLNTKEEIEFYSTGKAADFFKISRKNIEKVLSNRNKTFCCRQEIYDAQYLPKSREWKFDFTKDTSSKKILVTNLNTLENIEFESTAKAAIHFGTLRTSISNVINGRSNYFKDKNKNRYTVRLCK